MFKGILLIIVITSCGIMGLFKAQTYNQRVKELDQLLNMLQLLDTEISYRKDPLPSTFRRISARRNSVDSMILEKCCDYMDKHYDMSYCWKSAVQEVCKESALKAEDISLLLELGEQLGKSSIKGQTEALLLISDKLRYQITAAADEKNSKGKMYGGLGFSMGIVIAVLLI